MTGSTIIIVLNLFFLFYITKLNFVLFRLSLESPVVVIGDASGSMDIAIYTSTIIASLLTSICSAKLVFFNNKTRDAPFLPKTVQEVSLMRQVQTQFNLHSDFRQKSWTYK